DGRHRRLRSILRQQAERLQDGERADTIVHAARHDPPVWKLIQPGVDHADAADAYALQSFSTAARADINPQILDLAGLFALIRLHNMDGLLADDADDIALPAEQPDTLADEYLRIPAADARKREKALVVNI